jgi:hypothetical protein
MLKEREGEGGEKTSNEQGRLLLKGGQGEGGEEESIL